MTFIKVQSCEEFDSFMVLTVKNTTWRIWDGLINFNRLFSKTPRLAGLPRLESILLSSVTVN